MASTWELPYLWNSLSCELCDGNLDKPLPAAQRGRVNTSEFNTPWRRGQALDWNIGRINFGNFSE
jgi:hypothetical protein